MYCKRSRSVCSIDLGMDISEDQKDAMKSMICLL